MKTLLLKNSKVEVGILQECGHLFPVRFFFGKNTIEPMHIAPWVKEDLNGSMPPMLKYLRGDFFCAPFGASDVMPDETRGHGASANDKWDALETTKSSILLRLSKQIMGADLLKEISINDDESVVYQKHTFKGGSGKIPVGHHAMLRIPSRTYLSYSDFIFGGTPPEPVETNPSKGRSLLKYPQQFQAVKGGSQSGADLQQSAETLKKVKDNENKDIDISVYPFAEGHEDLYMIISSHDVPFGWSAASCPNEGWLWFSIKNPGILPNTVIWLSNGGRYYPPFSSRHKNVIGIEETVSFFHLGHKASVESNFLNEQGCRTYIELSHHNDITIPWIFGVVQIPQTFGRVKQIREIKGGIEIEDYNHNKTEAKVNLNFIRGTQ